MDRRMKDRVEYPARLRYRLADGPWQDGYLEDISTTGAKIWVRQEFAPNTELEIEMQSHLDPKPVRMPVRVVRVEPEPRQGFVALGCELL